MTTTTITFIALSALLLVTAFSLGRTAYISRRRFKQNRQLRAKINRYRMAANDLRPLYTVRRIDAADPEHEYNGVWAVCRNSWPEGHIHNSCIKIFTDEDDEFNKSEAEELCEKLNER